MTSGCPIWSRGLPARLAAGAARGCGNRLKHILKRGWRRRFDDPILVEGHANPLLLAPDDVTGNVRAVRPKDKVKTLGDVEGIRNIERRPGNGNVASS
jgi:hypothetical protein